MRPLCELCFISIKNWNFGETFSFIVLIFEWFQGSFLYFFKTLFGQNIDITERWWQNWYKIWSDPAEIFRRIQWILDEFAVKISASYHYNFWSKLPLTFDWFQNPLWCNKRLKNEFYHRPNHLKISGFADRYLTYKLSKFEPSSPTIKCIWTEFKKYVSVTIERTVFSLPIPESRPIF